MVERMRRFVLTPDEEDDIVVDSGIRARAIEECAVSLVGRLLSKRGFNRAALKDTMRKVWGSPGGLRIVDVGDNLFHFRFSNKLDLQRVLNGGPWCFDNMLLLLKKWEVGMTTESVEFHDVDFWVQLWGLPFECISPEIGKMIGNRIGVVVEMGKMTEQSEWGRYIHVRLKLPLDYPLRRGGNVVLGKGQKFWVDYKCERLPLFCHYCGRLNHETRDCSVKGNDELLGIVKENEYGLWMAASLGLRRGYNWRGNDNGRQNQRFGRGNTLTRLEPPVFEEVTADGGRNKGVMDARDGKNQDENMLRLSRLREVEDHTSVDINGNQFRMGDLVADSSRIPHLGVVCLGDNSSNIPNL